MSIFNIFNIFGKKRNESPDNPLEQERLKKISNSKSLLYSSVFENVSKAIKRDYVKNSKESYIFVDIQDLNVSNLDNDIKHKVALKATHDAASELKVNIRAGLDIEYPYINIRVYFE